MEPVITNEGIKILENPDQSRSLVSDYYKSLGFNVVSLTEMAKSALEREKDVKVKEEAQK